MIKYNAYFLNRGYELWWEKHMAKKKLANFFIFLFVFKVRLAKDAGCPPAWCKWDASSGPRLRRWPEAEDGTFSIPQASPTFPWTSRNAPVQVLTPTPPRLSLHHQARPEGTEPKWWVQLSHSHQPVTGRALVGLDSVVTVLKVAP